MLVPLLIDYLMIPISITVFILVSALFVVEQVFEEGVTIESPCLAGDQRCHRGYLSGGQRRNWRCYDGVAVILVPIISLVFVPSAALIIVVERVLEDVTIIDSPRLTGCPRRHR